MTENKENIKNRNIFRRIINFLLKLFFMFILLLVLLSVSVVGLSYFKFFRSFIATKVTNIINKNLIAKIQIDDISFTGLSSLKLYGVYLESEGDTLAYIPRLDIHAEIEPIFRNRIVVNNLTLHKPLIKLLRSKQDSLWNYEKIAKPSEKDTADTAPSQLKILVNHLRFNDARVIRYDSTIEYSKSRTLSYNHIDASDLNLILNANIDLTSNDYFTNIKKMSFIENNSNLIVKHLSTKAILNPKFLEVKNSVFATENSFIEFDAKMDNFDIFTGKGNSDIKNVVFSLDFKGDSIDIDDIYNFADIPILIVGKYKLDASFQGTLNEMYVKNISLDGNSVNINMMGKVDNILNIDDFAYNVRFDNSIITHRSASLILPELGLEKLPHFGLTEIKQMLVFGKTDTVFTEFDIVTEAGEIIGSAGSGFKPNETITYSINSSLKKVNLALITANRDLISKLNGNIKLHGGGTDLKNMYFNAEAKLDSGKFSKYLFSKLYLNADYKQSILNIDTLQLKLPRDKIFEDYDSEIKNLSNINLRGIFNFENIKNPEYDFKLNFQGLDINQLADVNNLPAYLSGKIEMVGKGIDLDSLETNFNANINQAFYYDKSFMPFSFKAEIKKFDDDTKLVGVTSDFFNARIEGKYIFSELFNSLANQGIYLASFINERINTVLALKKDSTNTDSLFQNDKIPYFPDIDCRFSAEIFDLSPLSTLIDSMYASVNSKFNLSLVSHDDYSELQIDSIMIKDIYFINNDLKIISDPINMKGNLLMSLSDSVPQFKSFNLDFINNGNIKFNDNLLSDSKANMKYEDDKINLKIESEFNKSIKFRSEMDAEIIVDNILLNIDSAVFNYEDKINWKIKEPIKAIFDNKGFYIETMNLARDTNEVIQLSGAVYENKFDDFNVNIENIDFEEFTSLIPESLENTFPKIDGIIKRMNITVNNSLNEPDIQFYTLIDSLSINNFILGNVKANLKHSKSEITGNFNIFDSELLDNKQLLSVKMNRFPYKIGFDTTGFKVVENIPMDIDIELNDLSLDFTSPFVPSISNIKGYADGKISFEGYLPDDVKTKGKASLRKVELLVDALNISYLGSGEVEIIDNKIVINEVNIRNTFEDNSSGRAKVTGYVYLDDFLPGEMNFNIEADKLLVLSDATRSQMPDLYGDFIISTGVKPLNFYGTLERPNLSGDINVNKAELKMIQTEEKARTTSKLEYIRIEDKQFAKITFMKDSSDTNITYKRTQPRNSREVNKNEQNIADLINYDLSIRLLSNLNILMDLGVLGEMYAVVRTENRNSPINYVKNRNEIEAKIYGSEIILDNRSTLKIGKVLKTSGIITFPKGLVQEPFLDISAFYNGTYTDDENQRHSFSVKIILKGTVENLDVSFTYFIDGNEVTGDKQKVETGALTTLLTGKPPEAGGSIGGNTAKDLSWSQASNFASKVLSDALAQSGVIQSAELDLNSDSFSESKVKVTGQLGDLNVSVGGSLQNIDESYEILIELPLSNYVENEFWRNWVIQLSRSTNNTSISNLDEKKWEFKVKFGGSW